MSGPKRLLTLIVVAAAIVTVLGVKSANQRKQAPSETKATAGQVCPTPPPTTKESDAGPTATRAAETGTPAVQAAKHPAPPQAAKDTAKPMPQTSAQPPTAKPAKPAPAAKPKALPKLVDLGAKSCIPCKMMAGVLDQLTKEYGGRLKVVFYDVWENPQAGKDYGIRVIPTQIFFDTSGKEFFRHEGYMPKEDILAAFKQHGIDLGAGK